MAKNKRPRKAYTPKRVSSRFVRMLMPMWKEDLDKIHIDIMLAFRLLREREGDIHQHAATMAGRLESAAIMAENLMNDGQEIAGGLRSAIDALREIYTQIVRNEPTNETDWNTVRDGLDVLMTVEGMCSRKELSAAYRNIAERNERLRGELHRLKQI